MNKDWRELLIRLQFLRGTKIILLMSCIPTRTSVYLLLWTCFKDQVSKTQENFINIVEIANRNVAMLAFTGASVNILNMQTFNVINRSTTDYQKSKKKFKKLKNKTKNTKVCMYRNDNLPLKIFDEVGYSNWYWNKIFGKDIFCNWN